MRPGRHDSRLRANNVANDGWQKKQRGHFGLFCLVPNDRNLSSRGGRIHLHLQRRCKCEPTMSATQLTSHPHRQRSSAPETRSSCQFTPRQLCRRRGIVDAIQPGIQCHRRQLNRSSPVLYQLTAPPSITVTSHLTRPILQ